MGQSGLRTGMLLLIAIPLIFASIQVPKYAHYFDKGVSAWVTCSISEQGEQKVPDTDEKKSLEGFSKDVLSRASGNSPETLADVTLEDLGTADIKNRVNFAADHLGAKLLYANKKVQNAKNILNPRKDKYLMTATSEPLDFVVELTETIVPEYIVLGNFELYSDGIQGFEVSVLKDNVYHEGENVWLSIGNFTATKERTKQVFALRNNTKRWMTRFLRVEVSSFYKKSSFATLSVMEVYGTREVDEIRRILSVSQTTLANVRSTLKNATIQRPVRKDIPKQLDVSLLKHISERVSNLELNATLVSAFLDDFTGQSNAAIVDVEMRILNLVKDRHTEALAYIEQQNNMIALLSRRMQRLHAAFGLVVTVFIATILFALTV
ncbi:hypothetical protein PCE1_000958 [Barthelona sp. PCE]